MRRIRKIKLFAPVFSVSIKEIPHANSGKITAQNKFLGADLRRRHFIGMKTKNPQARKMKSIFQANAALSYFHIMPGSIDHAYA